MKAKVQTGLADTLDTDGDADPRSSGKKGVKRKHDGSEHEGGPLQSAKEAKTDIEDIWQDPSLVQITAANTEVGRETLLTQR